MRTHKLNHDSFQTWLSGVAVAGLLAACGGGDTAPAGGAVATPPPSAEPPPAADTQPAGGAPAPADAPAPAAGGGGKASPELIALGDSIFHGQVGGGTCYACHGQDGKGTGVGP